MINRLILLISFISSSTGLLSQNTVLAKGYEGTHVVTLKWYTPKLIQTEGCNIYRKEAGSDWRLMNGHPVIFSDYKVDEKELLRDKELKDYLEMCREPANIKDLVFIAVLIKSFK